ILPKELREEIKDYFFANIAPKRFIRLPPRTEQLTAYSSKLISINHFCQIAAWLDNLIDADAYTPDDMPYTFHLLLRGSRDGTNDSHKFHEQCDNQGPTIIIIELANSNRVLGGYNPIDWKSEGGWGETSKGFLFSMDKYDYNTESNILSRIKTNKAAIWNAMKNPSFSHDLQWFSGKCIQKSYEKSIFDRESFSLTDYEVFKVVKREINKNDKRPSTPEDDGTDGFSDSGDSNKRFKSDDTIY
ncbi:12980_t:CDS:1, partial [Acaulospora morrowiae]